MNKLVLINSAFKDVYTKKVYKAGTTVILSDERIAEIKSVNPNFVTVIGPAEEPVVEEVIEEIMEETKAEKPKAKSKK